MTDDNLTFGYADFAGFLIGSTRDDFATGTGFPSEVCFEYGHEGFYPATGDNNSDGHVTFYDADWVVWVDSANNQPGFDPDSWIIHQFALRAGPSVPLDTPFGPTGPSDVRLGMSEADVTAAFPQAIVQTYDYPYPFWDSPDMTYIQHIVSALNGTFMVITTVGDAVVDVHWGSSSLGNGWQGTLCD